MKRSALFTVFMVGLVAGVFIGAVVLRHVRALGLPEAQATQTSTTSRPLPVPKRGEVVIDPAMLQNLGVRSVAVEPRVIGESIHTTGYVDYDQRRLSKVNARISGWVQKLYVAYAGQVVKNGQVMLDIYSPELVLTQEDYLRSRRLATGENGSEGAARRNGQDLMAAAEQRLKLWGIAPSELRRLERNGYPSETLPIQATTSGVVTESKVVEGAHVRAGDDLYAIADLSKVWVYADIYERELPLARVGQHAEVTSDALPGKTFNGTVAYIYPSVNEQTRTVRLRLEFPNPGLELRPGMYVNATLLAAPAAHKALAVPTEAVLNSGLRRLVIVDLGGGHFEPREISVGIESSGYFQVLSGLEPGDRIVTSAQFLIDSESNLNEVLGAMALRPEPGAEELRKAQPPAAAKPAGKPQERR
jgi:RND family efflux transporter MFP subunit